MNIGLSEELKEFKYGISSELAMLRNEMTFQINQEVAVVNLKLEQMESRILYGLDSKLTPKTIGVYIAIRSREEVKSCDGSLS